MSQRDLVRDQLARVEQYVSLSGRDKDRCMEKIVAAYTPGATHDDPHHSTAPVMGGDQIRKTLKAALAPLESIKFAIRHLIGDGNVVLTIVEATVVLKFGPVRVTRQYRQAFLFVFEGDLIVEFRAFLPYPPMLPNFLVRELLAALRRLFSR